MEGNTRPLPTPEALTGDRRHLLDAERRALAQQVLTMLEPTEGGG